MGNGIDMTNLAEMMLEWEKVQRRADELKAAIADTVMQLEKTQTVGNVRASFSAGRKRYDYEAAWRNEYDHLPSTDFRRVTYDYRGAVKDAGIKDVPFTQGAPSATVKLLT